jgi:hypothetical protein
MLGEITVAFILCQEKPSTASSGKSPVSLLAAIPLNSPKPLPTAPALRHNPRAPFSSMAF